MMTNVGYNSIGMSDNKFLKCFLICSIAKTMLKYSLFIASLSQDNSVIKTSQHQIIVIQPATEFVSFTCSVSYLGNEKVSYF